MKILYDISVLGKGHFQKRARTGIFRVVDNVARGLASSPGTELVFCSMESGKHSVEFMRGEQDFAAVPFAYHVPYERILHAKDTMHRCASQRSFPAYLPYKIARESMRTVAKIADRFRDPIYHKHLEQCDLFHSPFLPIPKRPLRKFPKVAKLLTLYDLIPILHPQFFKFGEDRILREVVESIDPETWILAISESTKNDLCSFRKDIDPARVVVTHLAADVSFHPCSDSEERSRVRSKYGIPEGPYFLSLSTLEPRKNIDHTIRCFIRMVEEQSIKDLNLVLAGTKGWDYDRIFQELASLTHLRDRVVVTGFVEQEDLAPLYGGAMAFVYPSHYEGFGLPPLEAMQCGVPVITSHNSSLPEVVGDAGIMVSSRDGDALCQAMLDLYLNGGQREELGKKSLKQSAKFSWERCVAETVATYQQARAASSSH